MKFPAVFVLIFFCFGCMAGPKVVHVLVALCDNKYQGIVPVQPALGNGQDPKNNLYWGALYGVNNFLGRQPEFTRIATIKNPDENILERVIFQYRDVYLIADAYDGRKIQDAVKEFFLYAAGHQNAPVNTDSLKLTGGSAADLLVFVGHNAFMDGEIPVTVRRGPSTHSNQAAVFACASRPYFQEKLERAGSKPLILTNGLMAPEAYLLHALVVNWAAGKKPAAIHEAVAAAYDKYQKCGMAGARRLFYYPQ